jgi:hypothetical protein
VYYRCKLTFEVIPAWTFNSAGDSSPVISFEWELRVQFTDLSISDIRAVTCGITRGEMNAAVLDEERQAFFRSVIPNLVNMETGAPMNPNSNSSTTTTSDATSNVVSLSTESSAAVTNLSFEERQRAIEDEANDEAILEVDVESVTTTD